MEMVRGVPPGNDRHTDSSPLTLKLVRKKRTGVVGVPMVKDCFLLLLESDASLYEVQFTHNTTNSVQLV